MTSRLTFCLSRTLLLKLEFIRVWVSKKLTGSVTWISWWSPATTRKYPGFQQGIQKLDPGHILAEVTSCSLAIKKHFKNSFFFYIGGKGRGTFSIGPLPGFQLDIHLPVGIPVHWILGSFTKGLLSTVANGTSIWDSSVRIGIAAVFHRILHSPQHSWRFFCF